MASFSEHIMKILELKASDMHMTVNMPTMARIDGKIQSVSDDILTNEELEKYCKEIMSPEQFATFDKLGELDLAYSINNIGRFRINAFKQRGSFAIAARVVNVKIPSPEKLGLPDALMSMCHKKRGLVLVTGATGSGKSTTLASMIDVINQNHPHHIITLEDPIEYLHKHNKSIINQREVGTDTMGFPPALRAALRQDPDVILIGEMRDLETISIAVTAAETGHLVFSTLHTIGAANTIDRIIDVFPPFQQQQIRTQLAEVLQCVVSQQLLPRERGGRVAAFELMLTNPAIKSNIRDAKIFQIPSIIQTNRKAGMQLMDDAISDLYNRNVISRETALNYAQDKNAMNIKLF